MSLEALFYVFSETPRQGPGCEASTLEALARLSPLPAGARVLDMGCGSGVQTAAVARATGARVVALDIYKPFLSALARRAPAISLVQASMDAAPFPPSSFDLVWSEGAAFVVTIPRSLEIWHGLLRAGGQAAFTEMTWFTTPPPEAARFFERTYPAMLDADGNRRLIRDAGFELISDFALPRRAWWEEFCVPLMSRIDALRDEAAKDPDLAETIAELDEEIDIYSRFGDSYGYIFYLLRKCA